MHDSANVFEQFLTVASSENADAVAIVTGDSRVSYSELRRRAAACGGSLENAGVKPGDRVAIVLRNTADFLCAAFATWSVGAVLTPLNPQLQEQERLTCLAGTAARAVVASDRDAAAIESLRAKGAPVDHLWLCHPCRLEWTYRPLGIAGSVGVRGPLSCNTATGILAAVTQYSTGSSGYPKRVTRSHGQLLGEWRSVANVVGVRRSDRVLGVTPFYHSHGLMNGALLALLAGASLHAVECFHAREVARLIERERITVFPGVPFMFQLMTELPQTYDFSSLRCVLSAGAPLSQGTARAFADRFGVSILQLYGTTETGVICINSRGGEPGCVGPPIPGVWVRVVDEAGVPLPVGVTGRIEVTSAFAAAGYDNDTGYSESYFEAGRFFPGDLGRTVGSGTDVVLCGRDRAFINVAGQKIDPREIESVLRELPQVAEVVVLGVPDGAANERIKAVLVTSVPTSEEEVRAHCSGRLAGFKHPRTIEFRAELPRSPVGKVLRKYLLDEGPAVH